MWEISERFPMPAEAKKTAANVAVRQDETRQYAPAFVEKVQAAAAQPSSAPMSAEQALARLGALTGKGANGR
jgi:hypothetical protein